VSGLNQVNIIGRLGQDPEVRFTAAGDEVTTLSVATSDEWKDKQTGEKKERTEWHRIVLFGPLAGIAGKFLTKGSQAYFSGQLRTRKWVDQSGTDRYSTEVVLSGPRAVLQLLSGGTGQGNGATASRGSQNASRSSAASYAEASGRGAPPVQQGFDDDVPF
jgi:single-strand DNA-binding protein